MKLRRPSGVRWGNRLKVQILGLIGTNAYYGASIGKSLCIPVLNCYACPIGTTACPIGSLSAFMFLQRIPFYIIGTLGLIGVSLGRAFCGWACPFGLVQDALYRIPGRKFRLPKVFNWLKYVLLIVLVLAVPLIMSANVEVNEAIEGSNRVVTDLGTLDYCSLICPVGTAEAGIYGLAVNQAIRDNLSWKSWLKLGILPVVLILVIFSSRLFCRSLCPLGAAMAVTSRVSLLQLKTQQDKCTRCMRCVKVCPTEARKVPEVSGTPESTAECVLCLDCVRNCPENGALLATFGGKTIMTSCRRGKKAAISATPEEVTRA